MPCNIMPRVDLPTRARRDEAIDVGRRLPQAATRGVDDATPQGRGVAWHPTNHHPLPSPPHQHQRGSDWVETGEGGGCILTHTFHNSTHSSLLDDVSGIAIVRRRGSVRRPLIRCIYRVRGEDFRWKGGIS